MADNDRVKELAAHMEKLVDLLELRDTEQGKRMERLETTLEVLARNMVTNPTATEKMKLTVTPASPVAAASPLQHGDSSTGGQMQWQNPAPAPAQYQPFQTKNVKIDFPRFDGTEPSDWIFKAEQFFEYYATSDDQRMTIASVHMDGTVVPWFQMMRKKNEIPTWAALTKEMELEFGPSRYEAPRAKLFKLSQTTTVIEYHRKFIVLANRAEGLSDDAVMDCFISGLKPEIRRDVLAQSPGTLSSAVALAKLYDEKGGWGMVQNRQRPHAVGFTPTVPLLMGPTTSTNTKPTARTGLPPLLPTPKTAPLAPVKRLSAAEMQLRREKGLCYTCDEKFSLTHKCPNKHFYVLQIDETEPEITEIETTEVTEENADEPTEHHFSFNSLSGDMAVGTIRFTGSISGQPVQILLDGGSSDNFIQPRLVKSLRIPAEPTSPFKVLVGNGSYLQGDSRVHDLGLEIQGNQVQVSAHVLPVTGADIVLGATWLATLGPHIADYRAGTIKFYHQDHFVTLCGDKRIKAQEAQFHHLKRIKATNSIAELFALHWATEVGPGESTLSLPDSLPMDLRSLLQAHSKVFNSPRGLPPQRAFDHRIPIPKNVPPVKVRPYRYPFIKKYAIEQLVQQMLDEGIIIPSSSPFSAPVILVNKKDGTWRFCTDYRALNAVTIKDSFPIPIVDELLDELHGGGLLLEARSTIGVSPNLGASGGQT